MLPCPYCDKSFSARGVEDQEVWEEHKKELMDHVQVKHEWVDISAIAWLSSPKR